MFEEPENLQKPGPCYNFDLESQDKTILTFSSFAKGKMKLYLRVCWKRYFVIKTT
jgi:hypothetical protein